MSTSGPPGDAPTVLHVAPHADDELIGAPATLMALRDAGWRVVNLTCSLGGVGEQERRRAELLDACRRAGFETEVLDKPLGDPLGEAESAAARLRVEEALADVIARLAPRLVVTPSPHDRHRAHEAAGRAVLSVCAGTPPAGAGAEAGAGVGVQRVWLWGLWADLPFPSLAVAFDEVRLDEILQALGAHRGELERNDYRRLVRGRAEMNASLGPERVFGFGGSGTESAYVELLCEVGLADGAWHLGTRRWLDPANPVEGLGDLVLDNWLSAPSLTDRFGPPAEMRR